jgi:hypothetical protein
MDWNPHRRAGTPARQHPRPARRLGTKPRRRLDHSRPRHPATAGLAPTRGLLACESGLGAPARLVGALLAQPGIDLVRQIGSACSQPGDRQRRGHRQPATEWQALDAQGHTIGPGPCGGAGRRPGLQCVACSLHQPHPAPAVRARAVVVGRYARRTCRPAPFSGQRKWRPGRPRSARTAGLARHMGSTFERNVDACRSPPPKWRLPMPPTGGAAGIAAHAAPTLQAAFASTSPSDSADGSARLGRVRCTATDRLPIVGPVDAPPCPACGCAPPWARAGSRGPCCAANCWPPCLPLPLEPACRWTPKNKTGPRLFHRAALRERTPPARRGGPCRVAAAGRRKHIDHQTRATRATALYKLIRIRSTKQ